MLFEPDQQPALGSDSVESGSKRGGHAGMVAGPHGSIPWALNPNAWATSSTRLAIQYGCPGYRLLSCVTVLLMSKGTTFLEIGQVLSEYTSEGSRETGCMFTPVCSSTTVSHCNYISASYNYGNIFFSLPLIWSIVFVIVLSKSCSRRSLIRKTRGLSLLHIVKISLILSHNIDL